MRRVDYFVWFLLTVSLCQISTFSAQSSMESIPACSNCNEHLLDSSYVNVRDFTSNLLLNNKGPKTASNFADFLHSERRSNSGAADRFAGKLPQITEKNVAFNLIHCQALTLLIPEMQMGGRRGFLRGQLKNVLYTKNLE